MAAATEERVVVAAAAAAEEETVTTTTTTTTTSSSSGNGNGGVGTTVTTTTTMHASTSRFGRLWGWGGGGDEAAAVEAASPVVVEEHEEVVTSVEHRTSLRKEETGSASTKHRTLSLLGPTAIGAAPTGLPSLTHREVFDALKARVEAGAAEDNVAPFNSDDYLNRVLVARNLDVAAAFKMWQGIVAWRKEYQPDALSEEAAAPYLSKGVISRCGPDKHGHPCIYATSKNHFIEPENHEANLRTIVHMLDAAKRESTEKGDGFIAVIIDQDQCGRKNMDTHLFIGRPGLVHILQDFYPETLAAAYIMHTSWLFRAVWVIISPFLDEKTRSKVKVLSKTEDILEHFDVEVLPPELQEKLGYTPNEQAK